MQYKVVARMVSHNADANPKKTLDSIYSSVIGVEAE
jgi:hypothetical protein